VLALEAGARAASPYFSDVEWLAQEH